MVDHHESSHHGDVATAVTVEETMDHECASQNTVSGKRDHNSACIAAGLGVGAGAGTGAGTSSGATGDRDGGRAIGGDHCCEAFLMETLGASLAELPKRFATNGCLRSGRAKLV